jgi:hypothetical protein
MTALMLHQVVHLALVIGKNNEQCKSPHPNRLRGTWEEFSGVPQFRQSPFLKPRERADEIGQRSILESIPWLP